MDIKFENSKTAGKKRWSKLTLITVSQKELSEHIKTAARSLEQWPCGALLRSSIGMVNN